VLLKDRLKYPIALFVVLIVAKIVYIFFESNYNYEILNVVTDPSFNRSKLEALNTKGHLIGSVGFTLFIIPILYFVANYINKNFYKWVMFAIFTLFSFFAIYNSLNYLVDFIVEKNSDKRYEAYYTNMVKFGILNNVIHYNSFIKNSHINSLTVEDRILLTNFFLLLYADKKLIEKFRNKGEINIIKLIAKKFEDNKIQAKYEELKNSAKNIEKEWIEFNKQKEKIVLILNKLDDEKEIEKAYDKMVDNLKKSYLKYQEAYILMHQTIQENTSLNKLQRFKSQLERFFRYRYYKKAQLKYKETMLKNFGHYVEPKKWLDKNGKLTYPSIENRIRIEIEQRVIKEVGGLREGLNIKQFINSIKVKSRVATKLKEYGILIPKDFDYSYLEFKKYYKVMVSKKKKEIIDKFYKNLNDKIGKNDLNLTMKWKDFVYSKYLTNQLKSKGLKNVKIYQDVLANRDLINLKSKILLPKLYKVLKEKLLFNKNEFYKNKEVAQYGDKAIKLLYIPPIALFLSITALLLNLITLMNMLMSLLQKNGLVNKAFFAITILIIIFAPSIFKNEQSNKIIKKSNIPYIEQITQWSSFWIGINFKLNEFVSFKSSTFN